MATATAAKRAAVDVLAALPEKHRAWLAQNDVTKTQARMILRVDIVDVHTFLREGQLDPRAVGGPRGCRVTTASIKRLLADRVEAEFGAVG
jgi:hypothetical protein